MTTPAPGEARRPDSDRELLEPILERIELLLRGAS